jgi:hypothetical protein
MKIPRPKVQLVFTLFEFLAGQGHECVESVLVAQECGEAKAASAGFEQLTRKYFFR